MKKISLIISILFIYSFTLFAQEISVINGVWERSNPDKIKLFRINNGYLSEIASTKLSEGKKFAFAFEPAEEGFYVIGLSALPTNRYTFYFKPGDRLNVKITSGSYELVGDNNTSENKEMAQWQEFIRPLESKSVYFSGKRSTYVDFFPLFEEKLEQLKDYPKANTSNSIFNDSFEKYKKYDILFLALNFIQTPRTAHPQDEDYPDYYRNIDIAGLTKDDFYMKLPGGMDLLMNTYFTTVRLSDKLSEKEKSDRFSNPANYLLGGIDNDKISNDVLKGEIALRLAGRNKTLAGFSDYKKNFEKYVITDDQKKRFLAFERSLNKNTAGSQALNFKFPDINGKEIALSDFKGKVVYIDVWATWCGPCKKELPHLKELEAAYHGNDNIVFMGISVDVSKDIQKWKNFMKKENLPGVQIFAGDRAKEELMGPYKIKGIPRFILVGKDGNLIFADAPRPSSSEIKAVIEDAIKK